MNNNKVPKRIVCSLLIGLLQFGGGGYIAEAAMREEQRIRPGASQDSYGSKMTHPEQYWQDRHQQQELELAERRRQEAIRHEQELRRRDVENEREWRHRQWLEHQRIQRQNEERARRQWWENQRHEEAMRRLANEREHEWRHRQWIERQRHEEAMREIEMGILALALVFGR